MVTQTPVAGTGVTLKAYEDKIAAQIKEAKARLDQLEAKARAKSDEAQIAAVASLNTARNNIERMLHDLKTTHESHAARAKADIDSAVAAFRTSVDELKHRIGSASEKKS
jgi:hypothetical protein